MIKALVTGANGFIGRHLCRALKSMPDVELQFFTKETDPDMLEAFMAWADVVYHLAGVNRPSDDTEFKNINCGLTEQMVSYAKLSPGKTKIIFASSTQATLDNPYGHSKRAAEDALQTYSVNTKNSVVIYRLPGVFGPGCKPFYNSVVATFCHQVQHAEPLVINDPNHSLHLVAVSTVIEQLLRHVHQNDVGVVWGEVDPVYTVSLQRLADTLLQFRDAESVELSPLLDDTLIDRLKNTYQSYAP